MRKGIAEVFKKKFYQEELDPRDQHMLDVLVGSRVVWDPQASEYPNATVERFVDLTRSMTEGRWGDHCDLEVLASMLNSPIMVFRPNTVENIEAGESVIKIEVVLGRDGTGLPLLFLQTNPDNQYTTHYTFIIPVRGEYASRYKHALRCVMSSSWFPRLIRWQEQDFAIFPIVGDGHCLYTTAQLWKVCSDATGNTEGASNSPHMPRGKEISKGDWTGGQTKKTAGGNSSCSGELLGSGKGKGGKSKVDGKAEAGGKAKAGKAYSGGSEEENDSTDFGTASNRGEYEYPPHANFRSCIAVTPACMPRVQVHEEEQPVIADLATAYGFPIIILEMTGGTVTAEHKHQIPEK
jgi:hypothetical protein